MAEYKKITPVEAKKIMDTENEIIVVDTRTQEEHDNDGYIFGSICISHDEIREKAENMLKDKKQKILVYCRSGRRSAEACETLVNMGYENIYDFGGILDWNFELVY